MEKLIIRGGWSFVSVDNGGQSVATPSGAIKRLKSSVDSWATKLLQVRFDLVRIHTAARERPCHINIVRGAVNLWAPSFFIVSSSHFMTTNVT